MSKMIIQRARQLHHYSQPQQFLKFYQLTESKFLCRKHPYIFKRKDEKDIPNYYRDPDGLLCLRLH